MFLFITYTTRIILRHCTFINHSLKCKVVIIARFLKHICDWVNFSKIPWLSCKNKYLKQVSFQARNQELFRAPFLLIISKYNYEERSLFYKVFLTLLTHQHHLVEFYLTMTKMALEIFQVITCLLGVTYNANVRLMLNMVVSLAVYKCLWLSTFRSSLQLPVTVFRIYAGKFSDLFFSVLHYYFEQTTEVTVVASHCIVTSHVNHQ